MDNFIISNASCSGSCTKEQLQDIDNSKSDWIVTKTCTLSGSLDEPGIYYHDGIGAINNIGMVGLPFEYYKCLEFNKPYVISIAGTRKDINQILQEDSSAAGYEINVSCPNISKRMGYIDVTDLQNLDCSNLSYDFQLGVKLPPFSDERAIEACSDYIRENECVRYIVCCNTGHRGCFVKDEKLEEGSLSGKYLKPIALWNVKKFKEYLPIGVEIFGCGGISILEDVQDFKLAGADGVQVGTAFIEEGPSIFSGLKEK